MSIYHIMSYKPYINTIREIQYNNAFNISDAWHRIAYKVQANWHLIMHE